MIASILFVQSLCKIMLFVILILQLHMHNSLKALVMEFFQLFDVPAMTCPFSQPQTNVEITTAK